MWPIVVENKFRDGPDEQVAHLRLIVYAKNHCSLAMQTFLFKRRRCLPGLLHAIWQWETVDELLVEATRSRVDTLRVALKQACVCSGQWPVLVTTSVVANGLSLRDLCPDMLAALTEGRSETTPVLAMAGAQGGEGKPFFLKALLPLFGHGNVFPSPEPGTFPLLDLPGK